MCIYVYMYICKYQVYRCLFFSRILDSQAAYVRCKPFEAGSVALASPPPQRAHHLPIWVASRRANVDEEEVEGARWASRSSITESPVTSVARESGIGWEI